MNLRRDRPVKGRPLTEGHLRLIDQLAALAVEQWLTQIDAQNPDDQQESGPPQ